MNTEILFLSWTALTVGLIHTATGPDHYLPFVMMSKARNWSTSKTIWITVLSGSGHVLSSILLGFLGIYIGSEILKLDALEAYRGDMAAWLLIGFGFTYFVWGVFKAIKNKKHTHVHVHEDGIVHTHPHSHVGQHTHVHDQKNKTKDLTPWILFVIFVLGPCEPLIPLMMTAADNSMAGMVLVATVFTVVTLVTMVGIVLLGVWGISFAKLGKLERYTHAFAGGAICLSGLAIMFLGL